MIGFNFDNDCCGCRVCADACPKHCIGMVKNSKGFFMPKVNPEVCIECGLCEKVCPVLNVQKQKEATPKLYCAYNKNEEIREIGSSGSIFFSVAKYVISNGGCVCGAAFVDGLQLKHIMVDKLEEIYPLMKSKYIQSNTEGIYRKVKKELANGRMVLFVGTPCQCQGLYNYLGRRNPKNLILMDFICHGVPNQELFDRCIFEYEQRNDCKVVDFVFRKKSKDFLQNCLINRQFCNGRQDEVMLKPDDFPFYKAYLNYFIFRNSCYSCRFVGDQRITDFTIGDFWGIERSGDVSDFYKGYSMLYVNTSDGENVLEIIKDDLSLSEFDTDSPKAINFAYKKPTPRSILNRCFMYDYNRISHSRLEKRYCTKFHDNPFLKKVLLYLIAKFKL